MGGYVEGRTKRFYEEDQEGKEEAEAKEAMKLPQTSIPKGKTITREKCRQAVLKRWRKYYESSKGRKRD
jgi:hypothetical protein